MSRKRETRAELVAQVSALIRDRDAEQAALGALVAGESPDAVETFSQGGTVFTSTLYRSMRAYGGVVLTTCASDPRYHHVAFLDDAVSAARSFENLDYMRPAHTAIMRLAWVRNNIAVSRDWQAAHA